MSLHGPRRRYRAQGPTPLKSAWGLRLASSTRRPHSLPQSLRHTPATLSHAAWLPLLGQEAPSLCSEAHHRCHLLQEVFPDLSSWLSPHCPLSVLSSSPLTLVCGHSLAGHTLNSPCTLSKPSTGSGPQEMLSKSLGHGSKQAALETESE